MYVKFKIFGMECVAESDYEPDADDEKTLFEYLCRNANDIATKMIMNGCVSVCEKEKDKQKGVQK